MVEFGLKLAHDVAVKAGAPIPKVISQRDVPGMTRSIIPILKRNGIQAISVGCNSGSAPPGVPQIFKWHDPISNETILSMWHPGGYGGELVRSVVMLPNFTHALMMGYNSSVITCV